jgi:DNA-directed RNA polymerase II subunit RPB2
MERDAMIAHGCSSFIKDRLFDVSDPYSVIICNNCGQITKKENECPVCNTDQVTQVNLPYAAKQLTHSLQAMGMKMSITSK